jgi:broad-specificity NMP kinase
MSTERLPNVLVTGTPGTGKSTLCELLSVRVRFPRFPSAALAWST